MTSERFFLWSIWSDLNVLDVGSLTESRKAIDFSDTCISLVTKGSFCVTFFTLQLSENPLTYVTSSARRVLTMGGGRGRSYAGRGASKGKGVGAPAKAVSKDSTLHLDLLRAYPAEDGSILLHRQGARSDAQILEPSFLTQLMSSENQELLNRPGKGLSMLAGSIIHGAIALQRSDEAMVQADRTALLGQLQELADACEKLDSTRKKEASVEEVKGALQKVLTFLNSVYLCTYGLLSASYKGTVSEMSLRAILKHFSGLVTLMINVNSTSSCPIYIGSGRGTSHTTCSVCLQYHSLYQ